MKKNNPYRHLLVLRLSALGDVAMVVPVLLVFTKTYPDVKITVVSRAFFKPLFDAIPNINFMVVDVKGKHKGILGILKLSRELRSLKGDAIADLHNVLRTNIIKQCFCFRRIPVIQINKGRKEKKALTRWSSKDITPLKSTQERYADVFGGLGFPLNLKENKFLEARKGSNKTEKFLAHKGEKLIGIAPFAAFKGKMYPIDLMEKVISKLNQNTANRILLFGGGNKERLILETIATKYKRVTSVVGQLSFAEELTLISNLNLMLAMDSGNAHLAANYNVSVITLWGVTHPSVGFYPFGQPLSNAILSDREKFPFIPTSVYGNKAPKGYEEVMKTITPNRIVDRISKLL